MLGAVAPSLPGLSPTERFGSVTRARSWQFSYVAAIVACLGIGALTLLVLPTDFGYDPWSWLIWGRELDHLTLTTRGSASAFKPLAVFIDAILAPAGHSAPKLWMTVVRGGTALSMVLAFRIGYRLHGVIAGVVAALALLTISNVSTYLALEGMAEPLEMCFCLAALDCGLSGRRRAATVWLLAASMLELELIGAMALYGLIFLVWPARRRLRALVNLALLGVLVALAWTLPYLLTGRGALKSAANTAAVPTAGGPLLTRVPALATITEVHKMLFWPLVAGWIAELLIGTFWLARRRSWRPLFLPALIAGLFVLGVAATAQLHRTTGTTRFLVAATAVGVVVAVCFWFDCTRTVVGYLEKYFSAHFDSTRIPATTRRRVARVAMSAAELVVLAVLLLFISGELTQWHKLVRTAVHRTRLGATAIDHLPGVIVAAGGAKALLDCGRVYTGPDEVPLVAWVLGVPSRRVSMGPGKALTGTVVSLTLAPAPIAPPDHFTPVPTEPKTTTEWQVASTCAL